MKQPGDEGKFRCAWGELPAVGAVIALHHRRTGKITRKMAVRKVSGKTVHYVLVPLDTPHTEDWVRESR